MKTNKFFLSTILLITALSFSCCDNKNDIINDVDKEPDYKTLIEGTWDLQYIIYDDIKYNVKDDIKDRDAIRQLNVNMIEFHNVRYNSGNMYYFTLIGYNTSLDIYLRLNKNVIWLGSVEYVIRHIDNKNMFLSRYYESREKTAYYSYKKRGE